MFEAELTAPDRVSQLLEEIEVGKTVIEAHGNLVLFVIRHEQGVTAQILTVDQALKLSEGIRAIAITASRNAQEPSKPEKGKSGEGQRHP
ncbi:hypothetical protein [Oricola sp.]|uniref:hypothetical protein n=1 Tax=Oricola sp. TaxID=1979950 RepID=UPI003BA95188